jgi:hypothetical protein
MNPGFTPKMYERLIKNPEKVEAVLWGSRLELIEKLIEMGHELINSGYAKVFKLNLKTKEEVKELNDLFIKHNVNVSLNIKLVLDY